MLNSISFFDDEPINRANNVINVCKCISNERKEQCCIRAVCFPGNRYWTNMNNVNKYPSEMKQWTFYKTQNEMNEWTKKKITEFAMKLDINDDVDEKTVEATYIYIFEFIKPHAHLFPLSLTFFLLSSFDNRLAKDHVVTMCTKHCRFYDVCSHVSKNCNEILCRICSFIHHTNQWQKKILWTILDEAKKKTSLEYVSVSPFFSLSFTLTTKIISTYYFYCINWSSIHFCDDRSTRVLNTHKKRNNDWATKSCISFYSQPAWCSSHTILWFFLCSTNK